MPVAAPEVFHPSQLPVNHKHFWDHTFFSSSSESQSSLTTSSSEAVEDSSHNGSPRKHSLRKKLARLRKSLFRSKSKPEGFKIHFEEDEVSKHSKATTSSQDEVSKHPNAITSGQDDVSKHPNAITSSQGDMSKHPNAITLSQQVTAPDDTSLAGGSVGRLPSVQVLDSEPIIAQFMPLPDSDDDAEVPLKRSVSAPEMSTREDHEQTTYNVIRPSVLDPKPEPSSKLELKRDAGNSPDQNSGTLMKIPTIISSISSTPSNISPYISGSGISYCKIAAFALAAGICVVVAPRAIRWLHHPISGGR